MTQADEELVTSEVRGCIEKFLKDFGVKNYTTHISAGTIRGDNYLGIIAKVQVNGVNKSGKDTTLNLIVKSAPRSGIFRSIAPIRQAYDREIYMYSKVFPEFCKLQEEKGVLQPFTSYAKYYSSMMDDMNEALIMEDMKVQGFELRDRRDPLDYNHALLVMREYGKFHALSFALGDHNPEVFKELMSNTNENFFAEMKDSDLIQSLQQQRDKAFLSLDPIRHKEAYDRFNNFKDNMVAVVKEVIKPIEKYAVIAHGDCWVNNMLFKYGNSAKPKCPTELCLLDWQLSRFGSPALDLSYFIFTCTDKELRDDHYEHLIQEYYNSLSSFLQKLGSDAEDLFPFEVLQEHLRKFSVFGLFMSIMVLYLMTSEVDEIPDIHSMTDMQDMLTKFQYEGRNISKYNSRIRGVILDFIKYGYDF